MLRITTSATLRTRAHSLAIALLTTAIFLLATSCTSGGSGSSCLIFSDGTLVEFDPGEIDGFDDFASTGAALGIGIDSGDSNVALIIAVRFSAATTERTYSPTCNPEEAIDGYDFAELNSITIDIAADNDFLTGGLTDTSGIETMDHSMNALLFINDEIDGLKIFLAVDGDITLTRDLGVASTARVIGDLTFVEITSASGAAVVAVDPELVRIDDIDMEWDTVVQPAG